MYWEFPVNSCYIQQYPEADEDKWNHLNRWHKQLKGFDYNDDEDGFRVIPPLPIDRQMKRTGIKCGLCGMKFEDGKPYLYSCNQRRCPIFRQITY